jgi:hypothetical protein
MNAIGINGGELILMILLAEKQNDCCNTRNSDTRDEAVWVDDN